MEQQDKYYTPDISELHVGYECKHTTCKGAFDVNLEDDIVKDKLTVDDLRRYLRYCGIHGDDIKDYIKTRYLDQSDIESCGWIKDWDENSSYSDCYKLITKSDISGQSDDEWVLWQYDKIVSIDNELSNRCFEGECKSINELRKIMKWLNIK